MVDAPMTWQRPSSSEAGGTVEVGALEAGGVFVVVGSLDSVLVVVDDVLVDEATGVLVGVAVVVRWPCAEQAVAGSAIRSSAAMTRCGRERGQVGNTSGVFQMLPTGR